MIKVFLMFHVFITDKKVSPPFYFFFFFHIFIHCHLLLNCGANFKSLAHRHTRNRHTRKQDNKNMVKKVLFLEEELNFKLYFLM